MNTEPMGKKLDERVGAGNGSLIRAFGRCYGALLALADLGFEVLMAEIDSDGGAALCISKPSGNLLAVLMNVQRTPLSESGDDSEGWIVFAELARKSETGEINPPVVVHWNEEATS